MAIQKPKGDIFGKSQKFIKTTKIKTQKFYTGSVKPKAIKAGGKLARHYKRYVRPTTKIVRGVGRFARGTAKLGLRFPGPTLALTAAYYGAKAIGKRQKGLKFSQYREFNKKGRKII
jgi:hypothetical protein